MKIEIYDIDGTLTYVHGDIPDTTGYSTYSFWPLISQHFTKDVGILNKMIVDWEESMRTEKDPVGSSHDMMQRSIESFKGGTTGADIRQFAKQVTLRLINCGAVRKEAIAFLEQRVKQGVICILSTGSYQDGALGFVDALVQAKLISIETQKALRVSGAIVDWFDCFLIHANVRERKLIGIEIVMNRKIKDLQFAISAVYGDDPWINDAGILAIAPKGKAYVISTVKNKDTPLPEGYTHTTWSLIIRQEALRLSQIDDPLEKKESSRIRAML